ncbi:hypothetical protein O0L34_g11394 [Tuta absoluta]|nr:hypothetical protein O0L34_g11394 [Tuta absoluta]
MLEAQLELKRVVNIHQRIDYEMELRPIITMLDPNFRFTTPDSSPTEFDLPAAKLSRPNLTHSEPTFPTTALAPTTCSSNLSIPYSNQFLPITQPTTTKHELSLASLLPVPLLRPPRPTTATVTYSAQKPITSPAPHPQLPAATPAFDPTLQQNSHPLANNSTSNFTSFQQLQPSTFNPSSSQPPNTQSQHNFLPYVPSLFCQYIDMTLNTFPPDQQIEAKRYIMTYLLQLEQTFTQPY